MNKNWQLNLFTTIIHHCIATTLVNAEGKEKEHTVWTAQPRNVVIVEVYSMCYVCFAFARPAIVFH